MKKMYACLLLIFGFFSAMSQDPFFFNTSQSLVWLNPSFTGGNGSIRTQSMYKGGNGTNLSVVNSVDAYIKPIKGGIAFSYLHDDISTGLLKSELFNLSYAQYFSLLNDRLKIIPSVSGGYGSKSLDASKIPVYTNIDSYRGIPTVQSQTRHYVDLNTALLVNYKHLYVGSSFRHLSRPDIGFSRTQRQSVLMTYHASYNWYVSEKALIHFFARFEGVKVLYYYYQASATALLFKHLIIGGGYLYDSYGKATANLGYRHRYFTLQGNYGLAPNGFNYLNSWEVSASFNLRNKDNRNLVTDFETW